ncbi:unnamed protein product [Vitrella brassicaformis CCMP3155]|uniref:Ubiquitin-like protease family profile domain-containing protein n=1 Tax=Vitrella brassicaformis (strain CCMP3155) TaxID=1169540 RepID=A0A0G4GNJ3_VITBC|nr:unnamed protein product [Vitrella brassicaformis CCMP3155]|eukprot:CEM31855.1 unnamed protein product [Vitrella brassicaformis CCMP3155]
MKGMAKDDESVFVPMLVPRVELEKGMPLVDEHTVQKTRSGRIKTKRSIDGAAESNIAASIAEPGVPKKTNNSRVAGLSESAMGLEVSFAGEREYLRGGVGLKDMAMSGNAGYGKSNLNKCASLLVNEAPEAVIPQPASPRKQPRSPDSKSPAHKCDSDNTKKGSRLAAPGGISLPPVGHRSEKGPGDCVVGEMADKQPPFPVAEEANARQQMGTAHNLGDRRRTDVAAKVPWFLKLSEDETAAALQLVDEGHEKGESLTVAKVSGIPVLGYDIVRLEDLAWLNDEIVNIIFAPAERWLRAQAAEGKCATGFNYDYQNVRRWSTEKKVNVFELDYLLVPINEGYATTGAGYQGTHWALGVVDFKAKRIRVLDSLGGGGTNWRKEDNSKFYESILHYLKDEHQNKLKRPMPDAHL